MRNKSLYHIDTDTLITLNPKGMILEVKKEFSLTFRLDKTKFTVLYLLCISHPHVVSYAEITEILETVDIELKSKKSINTLIKDLRAELKSYQIRNLIINIRGTGFAISNKWVEPTDVRSVSRRRIFMNYIRKLCEQVTCNEEAKSEKNQ